MFRTRLATWLLFLPLSLNGVWMVCVERSAPRSAETSAASAEAAGYCKEICPVRKPQGETASLDSPRPGDETQPGVICLVMPNGNGSWDAAFAFAVAPPVAFVSVMASPVISEATQEPPALYLNPSRTALTPPPKA
jgi:hypothetical protein